MKNSKNSLVVTIIILLALIALAGCQMSAHAYASTSSPIKIIEDEQGLLVMEGQKKVLFYRRQQAKFAGRLLPSKDTFADEILNNMLLSLDRRSRPHYIHPLYGLDGEVLTEDFPFEHLHHHGIFWAWHQILIGEKKMGDAWLMKDFSWDIQNIEILETNSESAAIKIELFWKSPHFRDAQGKEKPFIKETTIVRVHRSSENMRKIDFEITLLALEQGLRIGGSDDKKGYGGFSAHLLVPKEGLTFTSSKGPVKPKNTAIEGGPWIDFTGNFRGDGQLSGIAILCHKSNPGYPTTWILRRKESMQNAVYPGREPVPLSSESPLVLRYRLILHRGDVSKIDLDELQAKYNSE